MITKFARLEFEPFTKPSNLDFTRVHQTFAGAVSERYSDICYNWLIKPSSNSLCVSIQCIKPILWLMNA